MTLAWIGYSAIIAAALAIAARALEPVLLARGIALRWLWVSALALAVLIPCVLAVRPIEVAEIPTVASYDLGIAGGSGTNGPRVFDIDAFAASLWGGASLLMLAFVALGIAQLRRVRDRAPRERVAGTEVALADDIGPGTTWFGEPRIVLPRWACALGADDAALLVRHEREHLDARDPLVLAASLGALVLAPWNIALWYLVGRLRAAIELDCDARVLARGGDVRRYGELLLAVAARRSRRTPAVLLPFATFATSPSSLERRIRAMTERPTPLGRRRLALSFGVAAASVLVACEARRPAPVAPVTSYTVEDGRAKAAAAISAPQADSMRASVQGELRMRVADTVLAGDPSAPVLVVYASSGSLLYSARLPKDDQKAMGDAIPLNPEAIETMAVEKRAELLPPQAKGGMIRIVLKPGAENAPDTWKDGGVALRRSGAARGSGEATGPGASAGPSKQRTLSDSILVVVLDASGTQLLRAHGNVAMSRLDQSQIQSVDVYKNDATLPADAKHGMIKIVLKPGGALKP